MVIIDKWIVLQCPGKTSTILKYLRHQLVSLQKRNFFFFEFKH